VYVPLHMDILHIKYLPVGPSAYYNEDFYYYYFVCLFLKIYDPFVYIILYIPLKRCGDLARAREIVTFMVLYHNMYIFYNNNNNIISLL